MEREIDELNRLYAGGCKAKDSGNYALAFDYFQQAVEMAPNIPAIRLNLAMIALRLAKPRDAYLDIAYINAQETARLAPDVLGHWISLGEVALNCNKFPEAIAAYERALTMDPTHGFVHGLLGFAHVRHGQFDEGLAAFHRAIDLDPELGDTHFLLCGLYYERYYNPAKVAFHGERGFLAKKRTHLALESMWNSAHGYLALGDYAKGWNYFEARLRRNSTNAGMPLAIERYPGKPLWRGEKNLRLLVQTEMGLGDAFIMMRYLPLIKTAFGCDVQFECHGSMLKLCQQNFPEVACIPYGNVDPDSFDQQIPAMSLPLVFKTKSHTVPSYGAYIKADPVKIEEWREKLKLPANVLNVGLCWFSGRNSYSADNHHTSKRKSLTFEQIKPMLGTHGCNFVSLQTDRDHEMQGVGIKDFSDTAAIMELLDIVISVDTAVANLAGAMHKNLWLMDRFDHCWRWSDIDTPWYPTAKIYRQEAPRTWARVVANITDDLSQASGRIAA